VTRIHDPRMAPTGPELMSRSDIEGLVNRGYQVRQAPDRFEPISEKLAAEVAPPGRENTPTAWSLVYIDESFAFGLTCNSYQTAIEKLEMRGLQRALIIVPGEAMEDGTAVYDEKLRRCDLRNDGRFRVYSFTRKQLIDARDYSILAHSSPHFLK
jgi:hypothetical protein